MITYEELRKIVQYDPNTGIFTRLVRTSNYITIGGEAGYQKKCDKRWYRYISVGGKQIAAHRLAVLYMTGEWPPEYVDHKDQDGLNNRWDNLRLATRTQNNGNRRPTPNKYGKGVARQVKSGRYYARVGRYTYLGTYDTPEEAHAAYVSGAKKYFGEFARFD